MKRQLDMLVLLYLDTLLIKNHVQDREWPFVIGYIESCTIHVDVDVISASYVSPMPLSQPGNHVHAKTNIVLVSMIRGTTAV